MVELSTIHATLVFERTVPATCDRVFAAYADLAKRMKWGAPSENTTLVYDKANFSEGGEDVFRCGPKSNPNIQGITRYLDIDPDRRIVSSETVAMDGHRLCASLSTLEFHADGDKTILKSKISSHTSLGKTWFGAMKGVPTHPSTIWSNTSGPRTLDESIAQCLGNAAWQSDS